MRKILTILLLIYFDLNNCQVSGPSSNCSLVGPCQPGYIFVNGKCEIPNAKCPENYYYSQGFCHPIESQKIVPIVIPTMAPYEIDIPVPETLEPENVTQIIPIKTTTTERPWTTTTRRPDTTTSWWPRPTTTRRPETTTTTTSTTTTTPKWPQYENTTTEQPTSTTEKPCSIPTSCTTQPKVLVINNVIDRPNTVHVKHENNVFVHIKKGKNGKSIVIKNGNLTVYEDPTTERPKTRPTTSRTTTEEPEEDEENCCTVVSPRMCRKQENEWVCFHRKHQTCGPICTSETIYLKPRRPVNRPPYFIIPPRPMFPLGGCRMGLCPPTGKYRNYPLIVP